MLAWEVALLWPLALGVLLAERSGSAGARRSLRWLTLAVILLAFGIRVLGVPALV